ncbi:putative JmjC domain-containing histone demethylation protein 2C [Irineochytrium annulatum]|nr:putative JmjC domain-containing histone demethylation protein 2C [Irineochytrium annulatum]
MGQLSLVSVQPPQTGAQQPDDVVKTKQWRYIHMSGGALPMGVASGAHGGVSSGDDAIGVSLGGLTPVLGKLVQAVNEDAEIPVTGNGQSLREGHEVEPATRGNLLRKRDVGCASSRISMPDGTAGAGSMPMPPKGHYFGPGKGCGTKPQNANGNVKPYGKVLVEEAGHPAIKGKEVSPRAKARRKPKLVQVEGAPKRKKGRPKSSKAKKKRMAVKAPARAFDVEDLTNDNDEDLEIYIDEETEEEEEDIDELEDDDEGSTDEEVFIRPTKRRRGDDVKIHRSAPYAKRAIPFYREPSTDDDEFGIEDVPAHRDAQRKRTGDTRLTQSRPSKPALQAPMRKKVPRPRGIRAKPKNSSEIQLDIMRSTLPHLVSAAEAHADADVDPTAKYELQSATCIHQRYKEYLKCRVCALKGVVDEAVDGPCRFEGFRVFGFRAVSENVGDLTYGPFFEQFEEGAVAGADGALANAMQRAPADDWNKSTLELVVKGGGSSDDEDEDEDEDTVIRTDAATERMVLSRTAPTMLALLRRDLPILRRAIDRSIRPRIPVARSPSAPPSARPPACDACRTSLSATHHWACAVCCKRLCDGCYASFRDPTPRQEEEAKEEVGVLRRIDRRGPAQCLREYLHRKAQWMLVARRGVAEVTAMGARVEGLLAMVEEEERKDALGVVEDEEREKVENFLNEEDLADDSDDETEVGVPGGSEVAAAAESAPKGITSDGETSGGSDRAAGTLVTIDGSASEEEVKVRFEKAWAEARVVVFKHARGDDEMLKADWTPEGIAELLPEGAEAKASDCAEAASGTVSVHAVLRGFEELASRPREFQEEMEVEQEKGEPEGTKATAQAITLRIENFPQNTTLKSILPVYHFDYILSLPVAHRTGPAGALNLAARLASSAAGDMSPKLLIGYCSMGRDRTSGAGTLPMRLEPADTVTRCFVASLPPRTANNAGASGDEAYGDDVAAVWDVFAARDVTALRTFLKSEVDAGRIRLGSDPTRMAGPRRGRQPSGFMREIEDVIFDASLFLDCEARARMWKATGVKSLTVVQRVGESVIVPAGCARQVRFLRDCVMATSGFLSPESVSACYRLMEERRTLSAGHANRGDMLHLKAALWETWATSPYFNV